MTSWFSLSEENAQLKEKNARLREALEYYAMRQRYWSTILLHDCGERARKALGEEE